MAKSYSNEKNIFTCMDVGKKYSMLIYWREKCDSNININNKYQGKTCLCLV